jgi:hypothetical protein
MACHVRTVDRAGEILVFGYEPGEEVPDESVVVLIGPEDPFPVGMLFSARP